MSTINPFDFSDLCGDFRHSMSNNTEVYGTIATVDGAHALKIEPYHSSGGWGGTWLKCTCGFYAHVDGYGRDDNSDDPVDDLHRIMLGAAEQYHRDYLQESR